MKKFVKVLIVLLLLVSSIGTYAEIKDGDPELPLPCPIVTSHPQGLADLRLIK